MSHTGTLLRALRSSSPAKSAASVAAAMASVAAPVKNRSDQPSSVLAPSSDALCF